jgi:hypothetical protein
MNTNGLSIRRANVMLSYMIYDRRVHAGFDHANMSHTNEHRLRIAMNDALCAIDGRKHAGLGHANMLTMKQASD